MKCCALLLILLCSDAFGADQSLGEIAHREAERRKAVDLSGTASREISAEQINGSHAGNISTSRLPPRAPTPPPKSPALEKALSLASFRSKLKKLDDEIRQCEDRLARAKEMAAAEKKIVPILSRKAAETSISANQKRIQEIRSLESRLAKLRQDRMECYGAGRRAGYLPGELDGHGLIP
jgi:hypothetical protein